MDKQFIPTGDNPKVTIVAHGKLVLKGSDEAQVMAKASSDRDLSLEHSGDEVRIECHSDCTVRVPRQATVLIEKASGEAVIKAVEGELFVKQAGGALQLRNVGPVRIERLSGDLQARHVDGNFEIGSVGGNAYLRDVQGEFKVDGSVSGNLNLDEVEGDAQANTGGNITLRLDPGPDQKYAFRCSGNLTCKLPADASVKLKITASGNARVVVGDTNLSITQKGFETVLGDGDADMELQAGGNILVSGQVEDWGAREDFDIDVDTTGWENVAEDVSRQVTEQVEAQMEMLQSQLESQMENLAATLGSIGMRGEDAERIAARAREASARATARAQEQMKRAQERMQRKMEDIQRRTQAQRARAEREAERAARRAQGRGERRSWGFEWPGSRPEPNNEPVSDDERMMILKMLEEKKISPEEADNLLSALE